MKLTVLASCTALAAGFQAGSPAGLIQAPSSSRTAASPPLCSLQGEGKNLARRYVINTAIGATVGVSAIPAWAGYVTSLGIETTSKEDAEIDQELLRSSQVQDSIKNVQRYQKVGQFLKGKFDENSNVVIIPFIRKEFDFSKVRNDLNIVTGVFDEDTQKTIDRIARSVLYDLSELENSSRFKDGETTRTPKKTANVQKWFKKLDEDLTTFLSYVK
jgi:hypothetical protein